MDGSLDRLPQRVGFEERFEIFWDDLKGKLGSSAEFDLTLNPNLEMLEEMVTSPSLRKGRTIHMIKIFDPQNKKEHKKLIWFGDLLIPQDVRMMVYSNWKRYGLDTSHERSFKPEDGRGRDLEDYQLKEVINWFGRPAGRHRLRDEFPRISRFLGLK